MAAEKVVDMVDAAIDYARAADMTYGEVCQAIERLHLFVLMRMLDNEHEVADYIAHYGEHVANLIRSGAIQIKVAKPPTMH